MPKATDVKPIDETATWSLKHKADLDPLMERIGDSRIVLLGEASHGTHEYYTWRAQITKRLIEEKGFSFVAVEGDWPDCYRINRYIKGYPDSGKSAFEVLHEFRRWPTWMWANWEISAFAEWLKQHNDNHKSDGGKAGFYGLDVYSLWESLDEIMKYLKGKDKETAAWAEKAIDCFNMYCDRNAQEYALSTSLVPTSCQYEVASLLREIRRNKNTYNHDPEASLNAEQNASVIVNAEEYYRMMIRAGDETWNMRDRHMGKTLERLLNFHGPRSKAVVWEHNTHIGDARATTMSAQGMINLGQLMREKFSAEDVVLVGFGSYQGKVVAGRSWGDTMRVMPVPEAIQGSWEYYLHRQYQADVLMIFAKHSTDEILHKPVLHRAIGVVYDPEHEKRGNYVPSVLAKRYDAFIFIDRTRALHPLHIEPDGEEIPETYPWGV